MKTYRKGFYMKKAFLTVGTMAFLASPSLFAVDAVRTQTQKTIQTQQKLQDGTGMGSKKQYKDQYEKQYEKRYEYQDTNGKQQGKGQGNMSDMGQGKGQGNMSGMGQGNKGGKGGGSGGKR